MESPGEHLKREREHRGVSLQKIFESTRVPMKYLEAIEADRVEGLPQTAFVKGYIRNYCKVLGLDENDAVLRYEVWLADRTAEAEAAAKPKPVQELKRKKSSGNSVKHEGESKLPPYFGKAAIIAAGVIIIILAYALTKRDLSAPEQAMAPEPAAQAVVESAPPAPGGQQAVLPAPEPQAPQEVVSAAPAQKPAASGVPMALAPAPQKPAASGVPMVLTPAAQKPVQPVQAEPQPVQKATQPEPVKKEVPGPGTLNENGAPKTHTLIANARDTVWLKVGIDKEEPVEVLLKQGERFTWKASDNISVIIGNAGGVTLTYNGRDISGLGASGEVVGLRLPSGTSYKIKKPQPAEPSQSPAINMPEVPAAVPQSAPGE